MNNAFIPARGLSTLIDDWLRPVLAYTNWLFVNLDSAYGHYLLDKQRFLSLQLQKEQIEFWWEDEGLWLPGIELKRDFIIDKIVVNFSAAFIFPSKERRCPNPNFHDTTDRGEFTELQLKTVSQEIIRLKAKGYVADGCGLQCVFADEHLSNMIQQ
jgi:hypothetical protein